MLEQILYESMKRTRVVSLFLISVSTLSVLLWIKLPQGIKSKLDPVYLANRAAFKLRDLLDYRENLDSERIIRSGWHVLKLKTIGARNYLTNGCREPGYGHYLSRCNEKEYQLKGIPGGYIDEFTNGHILGINGIGHMFTYRINQERPEKLKSNLNEIYNKQDYKGKLQKNLAGRFGYKGLFYDKHDGYIYASLFLNNGNSCYGMGMVRTTKKWRPEEILLAQATGKTVVFDEFYRTKACNSNFNGHASGGRIARLGSNLLFAVGFLDIYTDKSGNTKIDPVLGHVPRLPSTSEAGKFLLINPSQPSSVQIFSSGHRNPQGLTVHGSVVISTEHGPFGGDEVNLIKRGSDYGWPIYSYAYDYDGKEKFLNPESGTSEKPLYYFTPSIGISETLVYTGSMFSKWKDKLLVSSLKDNALYILHLDYQNKSVKSAEKINIGARIRDMALLQDGSLVFVTDSQTIKHLTAASTHTKDYYPLAE